jgi:hypothetical protein
LPSKNAMAIGWPTTGSVRSGVVGLVDMVFSPGLCWV